MPFSFLPRYREKDRFKKKDKCSRKASSDPRRPFLIPEMESTQKLIKHGLFYFFRKMHGFRDILRRKKTKNPKKRCFR